MARKLGVAVEDVVAAAAEIAAADGLAAVTLSAVARKVGVRPPSLYAHVSGLDGLLRLLALRAAREMELAFRNAKGGRTGNAALRALMHEYRRFARSSPGLYAATQRAVRPGEDDELYEAFAAVVVPVMEALTEAGVESDDLVHMTRAIRSAMHGFVELEHASGFGMPEPLDVSFEHLVNLLLRGVGPPGTAAGQPPSAPETPRAGSGRRPR